MHVALCYPGMGQVRVLAVRPTEFDARYAALLWLNDMLDGYKGDREMQDFLADEIRFWFLTEEKAWMRLPNVMKRYVQYESEPPETSESPPSSTPSDVLAYAGMTVSCLPIEIGSYPSTTGRDEGSSGT